jgi:GAF domain-containing protein
MSVAKMPDGAALAKFNDLLAASGARDALAYLVTLTDYRFIAIFRFQNEKSKTIFFYDRENPLVENTEEAEISSTYCCYVRDDKGVFMTANAMQDARMAGHPKRDMLASYCGVPILDSEGAILGTLCHYDVMPRDPDQIDLPLMLSVASALSRSNSVPAYPVN